ncbi:hypothetical protein [Candidatus Albibeggiatoa sp. nov. NOAA]|nr:hypothetical protein [Thiotrichaceae bacterium]
MLKQVVIPDFLPIYAFYPARQYIAPKTRVFLALLVEYVKQYKQLHNI